VIAIFDDLDAAAVVVQRVMRSPLRPLAMELLNARAAQSVGLPQAISSGGCVLLVLVGGFERAVARVTEEIAGFCRESGKAEVRGDDEGLRRLWQMVRNLADASERERPVLKLAVPPAATVDALGQLRSSLENRGLEAELLAHAGVGLAYARLEPRQWNNESLALLAEAISEARVFANARAGSLVVESCPTELKGQIDVWGEIGPALRLMRALKDQLDPRGTLNPGRYVGGI
jgi:glycolate oxidase FAD binding subunit